MDELVGTFKKKQPGYLLWYDDDPKIPTIQKIEEALEAYVKSKRWQKQPNIVLVNEVDLVALEDVTVRSSAHIRRNHFWIGREEAVVVEDAPVGDATLAATDAIAETMVVEPHVTPRKTRAAKKSLATPEVAAPAEQMSETPAVEPTLVAASRRTRKGRGSDSEPIAQIAPVIEASTSEAHEAVADTPRKRRTPRQKIEAVSAEAVVETATEPVVQLTGKRRAAKKADTDTVADTQVVQDVVVGAADALAAIEPATRKTRGRKAALVAEQHVVEATPVAAETSTERAGKKRRAATTSVAVDQPAVEAAPSEHVDKPAPAVKGKDRRAAKMVAETNTAADLSTSETAPTEPQTPRKNRRGSAVAQVASEHEVETPVATAELEPQPVAPRRKAKQAPLDTREAVEQASVAVTGGSVPKRRARRSVQPELEQASLPL